MINFLKGIIAGIGGVAPGLSGSVLLIICGLYQKTLDTLGTLFNNFKKNVRFLLPIVSGMFLGVILFSKVLDFFLNNYEMQTRFCFLGLILGTIPLFYKEVKKNGFSKKYYLVIVLAFVIGIFLFTVNTDGIKQISNPNIFQSVFLGVAVVATSIIPGLDTAVILSTLGYYEVYVSSLADFNLNVLLPMFIGLAVGGITISYIMSALFRRFYTATFSVVFGMFLSMIPNILNKSCVLEKNIVSMISLGVMLGGFCISYYLGDIKKHNRYIKAIFEGRKCIKEG